MPLIDWTGLEFLFTQEFNEFVLAGVQVGVMILSVNIGFSIFKKVIR